MKTVFYEHSKDNKPKPPFDLTWAELCEVLSQFSEEPDKAKTPAWSPVAFTAGSLRDQASVIEISCAVFDLDKASITQVANTKQLLEGVAYHEHTSWSHTAEKPKLRIVIPFKDAFENSGEPVSKNLWVKIYTSIAFKFAIAFDSKCKDLGRIYFLPSYPPNTPEGTEFAITHEGELLDWHSYSEAQSNSSHLQLVPQPDRTSDMTALRARVAAIKSPKHKELRMRVVRGEPLSETGGRDDALRDVAASVVGAIRDITENEFVEIVRESLSKMKHEVGETTESWTKEARKKFRSAFVFSESERLKNEAQNAENLAAFSGLAEKQRQDPSVVIPDELLISDLETTTNKEGAVHVKNSWRNGFEILTKFSRWRGAFRHNCVTGIDECVAGPPELRGVGDENLAVRVAILLDEDRPERIKLDPRQVYELIQAVSEASPYEPVVNYLQSVCSQNDQLIETLAITHLNANKTDELGRDIVGYVCKAVRYSLLGAVNRAHVPGCQLDTMLILESEQGYGKSSALKILGGEFYSEATLTAGEKDTGLIVKQSWLIEIPELNHSGRAAEDRNKAFLSKREDEFRSPYARKTIKHKRRCSFIGTTNPDGGGYFTDITGNRRLWPVRVGRIDLAKLSLDRDTIWGALEFIYQESLACLSCPNSVGGKCERHRWWFSAEDELEQVEQANQRMETNDLPTLITLKWREKRLIERPPSMSTSDIKMLLGNDVLRMLGDKAVTSRQIGAAARAVGFKSKKEAGGYRYYATPELLALPVVARNSTSAALIDIEDAEAKTYEN